MLVYANLSKLPEDPNAEWDPRQRIEILRIRSDGNGHFWFKPDLSGGRPPYRISQASATLSSEWRYKIEGVQIGPVQDLENSKEGAIRAPQVPWALPSPDEGRQKTFIFGEVMSAHGFEYDHVSIILKNSSNAQTCVTHAVSPRNDCRYYSFPFEFEFEHSENTKSGDLIVEAVSYGFFGNRRIEGYGYAAIPQKTGNHLVTIPCWRPKQGIYEELRRSFLGGTGELISLNPIGCPNTNSSKISRLGLFTCSTGQVKVRLKIVRHHPTRILKQNSKLGLNIQQDENSILEQFQKARDKMLRMKQTLPKHYTK